MDRLPDDPELSARLRDAAGDIGDYGAMQEVADSINLAHLRGEVDRRSTIGGQIGQIVGKLIDKVTGN